MGFAEPSGSVAEKLTVTLWPTKGEGGVIEEMVTTGGRSFTTSVVVPEPGPAPFVAVTVIVKVLDFTAPVLV